MTDPILALLHRESAKPCWREGPANRKPPSKKKLRAQRWTGVKRLGKYCPDDPKAQKLARGLYDCTRLINCDQSSCPECGQKGKRWFVDEMRSIYERGNPPWSFVTLIPNITIQWTEERPKRIIRRMVIDLKKSCSKARLTFAAFVLDISCNSSVTDPSSSYLQPHWHGVVVTDEFEKDRAPFKIRFPTKHQGDTPILAKPFDGDPRAFAYMADIPNERRLIIPANHGEPISTRQNTRADELHACEHARMMVLLNDIGFKRRLVLHGCSVKHNSDGYPKIVLDR